MKMDKKVLLSVLVLGICTARAEPVHTLNQQEHHIAREHKQVEDSWWDKSGDALNEQWESLKTYWSDFSEASGDKWDDAKKVFDEKYDAFKGSMTDMFERSQQKRFVDAAEAQLDSAEKRIDRIENRLKEASQDDAAELKTELALMRNRYEVAEKNLEQLEDADEVKWLSLRDNYNESIAPLNDSLAKAERKLGYSRQHLSDDVEETVDKLNNRIDKLDAKRKWAESEIDKLKAKRDELNKMNEQVGNTDRDELEKLGRKIDDKRKEICHDLDTMRQ